ncbi:MAG: UDP-N-acetylmuramoyl-tripeptide--D-alanyl-D-alanine ligase [Oligoflexia bacterium]|nr:UDP-N-acetylmuramoyl-tripeptide--D-alanyl-D-alanine ligase [Oligoflexia bacterium]
MSLIKKSLIEKCKSFVKFGNNKPINFESICTDNRKYKKESAFIFLEGPNFDSYNFLDDVVKLENIETLVCRWSEERESIYSYDKQVVWVRDTLKFIQELGHLIAEEFKKKHPLIGITGSNGKTTNKEYLKKLISLVVEEEKIISTLGNLNNHIGVPLTLMRIKEETKIAIIEMGSNNFGEIKFLSEMASPNYAMITSIGEAHLENFINLEGVLKEKRALYDFINSSEESKNVVLNFSDCYLKKLDVTEKVLTLNDQLNGFANYSLTDEGLDILSGNKKISIKNKSIVGDHNKYNLAQCFILASKIYPALWNMEDEINKISFDIELNRGTFLEWNNAKVYLDAYNANPASMKASIAGYQKDTSAIKNDNKLFILGDMNELGENSEKYHQEIAEYVKNLGLKNVFFVGQFAMHYKVGFEQGNVFESAQQCAPEVVKFVRENGIKSVFIKGSRSLQLESILDIKS